MIETLMIMRLSRVSTHIFLLKSVLMLVLLLIRKSLGGDLFAGSVLLLSVLVVFEGGEGRID